MYQKKLKLCLIRIHQHHHTILMLMLPMIIYPHQCFYLSPFNINGKGYLPLGMIPITELSMGMLPLYSCLLLLSLSPFEKGLQPSFLAPSCLPKIYIPNVDNLSLSLNQPLLLSTCTKNL
jgi:hypothetical protein